MPSTPFTMTWPKLGEENPEVLQSLKTYSAAKYGRPRGEVSREIDARLAASNKEGKVKPEATRDGGKVYVAPGKEEREENFLEAWERKKKELKTEVKQMNEARSQNATETATRREKKADDFWKSGEKISIRS